MKDIVIHSLGFTLGYAKQLTADIPDDKMTAQPVAGKTVNHPAWLIGHITWAADRGVKMLTIPAATPVDMAALNTLPGVVPAEWTALFAPKTQPLADASRYPSKAELVGTLEKVHTAAIEALTKATPEQLAKPLPEPMNKRFPTVQHFAALLLTSHESMHLGQLSMWRRMMGLPSVM